MIDTDSGEGALRGSLPPIPDPSRRPGETEHERFHRASMLGPLGSRHARRLCVQCGPTYDSPSRADLEQLAARNRGGAA